MTDANSAPRRVSMAYILGFSNKPFKDGGPPVPAQPPPPRNPSAFKQMVTTPGGVLEWAASDGRRGRLTGPGKPRLTASTPSQPSDSKPAAEKDAGDDGGVLGMEDLFGETPAAPASAKDDKPKDSGWTKEQDDKLLELRADTGPWTAMAEALGKNQHECRERFKQIRPADWRPNNSKGGETKQGKQKGQKNQENQNDGEKDGENKEGGNKGGEKKNEAAPADNTWGAGDWSKTDKNGATQDTSNTWGGDTWGGGTGGDNKSASGENKADAGFSGNDNSWGGGGGDSGNNNGGGWGSPPADGGTGGAGGGWDGGDGANSGNDNAGGWGAPADSGGGNNAGWGTKPPDTTATAAPDANNNNNNNNNSNNNNKNNNSNNNNNKNNTTTGLDANTAVWPTAPNAPTSPTQKQTPPKNSSQNQSNAKPPSQPTTNPTNTPLVPPSQPEFELTPDSTFSAHDLRLIARILQQDSRMVWERVSWRFWDKTGRRVAVEVIERKVTGGVGGKRSGKEG